LLRGVRSYIEEPDDSEKVLGTALQQTLLRVLTSYSVLSTLGPLEGVKGNFKKVPLIKPREARCRQGGMNYSFLYVYNVFFAVLTLMTTMKKRLLRR
jgi:hypothetical protein